MITLIKYGKTINTGDYNSERIDAEYQVGEGECAVEAMKKLKHFVNTGEYNKPEKLVAKADKVEEKKVEEAPVEEKKPAKKKTTKKKPAKKVVKEVKPEVVNYNREDKSHKKILGDTLKKYNENWKAEAKDECVAFSKDLEGKPFLDAKGVILSEVEKQIQDLLSEDL